MAFYDYYRQNLPGGGSALTPPQPFFQPQPSWGGMDYFRAQAQAADSALYEYGLQRIQGMNFMQGGAGASIGAGIEEAKILHQRAYFGEMKPMAPSDIGAAAAYEAWRNWSAYQGVYMQPLSADRERQREALVGMAIGEASNLWGFTLNPMDTQGRMVAVESAAATAAKIFIQTTSGGSGGYGMGGSPLMGAATAGAPLTPTMASGYGAGVGGGMPLTPGITPGVAGSGGYLNVPRPMMRRRSMSDVGAAGMYGGAGYGGGMGYDGMGGMGGNYGAGGMGYGGMGGAGGMGMGGVGGMGMGGVGGMGGIDGVGGGMGGLGGLGGMGAAGSMSGGYFPGAAGSYGGGGGGLMPGGAGYGMGGMGPGMGGAVGALEARHPFASTMGMLGGELEGRHRRRRSGSRSRRRHRRRSFDVEPLGAELAGGLAGGGMGGYGGGYGGYGGYGGGYGGYGGYGRHHGALAAGLAAGAQGYAAAR